MFTFGNKANGKYDWSMGEHGALAENIGKRLNELHKSQAWLAKATGLTRGAISKLVSGETKKPEAQTVAAIARALGVSSEYLNGETENPERSDSSPMPEYAQAVLERMREMDAHGNYIVRLLADSLSENKQQFRYISLMTVINWIIEEYGLSEEGEQLAELLERFERRVTRRLPAKEPGAQPVQPD